jgi:hypothetical protein
MVNFVGDVHVSPGSDDDADQSDVVIEDREKKGCIAS